MQNLSFKILAIDDNPDNLISLRALIQDVFPQATTLTAQDGKSGLALATREDPDVVLLDIVMPGTDGFEVCRQMKNDTDLQDIPVVFLTALKGDRENRIRALEAGAEAFLSKPVDETELTAQIRAMVKIKHANIEKRDEARRLERLIRQRTRELEKELEERKVAEAALQESEEKFAKAFQGSPYMLTIMRLSDGQLIEVNETFCQTTGYSREEILTDNSVSSGLWVDETGRSEVLRMLHQGEAVINEECWFRKKNKEILLGSVSIKLLNLNGEPCAISSIEDITERKQAEERLRTSDRVFNHSIDMLCIAGFDGYFKVLNPAWTSTLGWSSEELKSKPWIEFVHPDDKNPTNEIKETIIDGKTVFQFENRYICKDGKTKWLSWNSYPYPEEKIMFGVARDVTEQRRREKEYETLFQEMLDSFALHEIILDANGKPVDYTFIAVNQAFEQMTGLTGSEIVGKTVKEVLPNTEPYWIELYGKVAMGGEPVHFENYSQELQRYYEVKAFCPAQHQFVTIFSDITDRLKAEKLLRISEERLSFSMEATNDGLWDWYLDTNKAFFSPQYYRMLGYEPNEFPACFESWQKLVHPDDYPALEKIIMEAIGSATGFEAEFRLSTKQGGWKWILGRGKVMELDAQGKPLRMVGTHIDITERKQSEAKIRESEETYRNLFQNAQVGLFRTRISDGQILESNDQLAKMFGFDSREEFIAVYKTSDNYVDSGTREKMLEEISRNGYIQNFEARFYRKDRSILWTSYSARIYPGKGWIEGVALDISDIKTADAQNELLSSIIRRSQDFIGVATPDQRAVYVNPAGQAMLGIDGDDAARNTSIEDYFFTEDLPFVKEKIFPAIQKEGRWKGEFRFRHFKTGEAVNILYDLFRTDDPVSGETINISTISRDITNRKRNETIQQIQYNIARSILQAQDLESLLGIVRQELGRLLDTTNFFVALYNPETDTMKQVIFKDEKDEVFEEWPASDSISGHVVKLKKTIFLKGNEMDAFSNEYNIPVIGANAASWLGVPITVDNGVAGAMVIQSYTDTEAFTAAGVALLEMVAHETGLFIERTKMMQDLISAKEKAEESSKLKTAFINNISHEIRTPLNGILGFGQFLSDPGLSPEEREDYCGLIKQSSDRLMQTITDYVDISMITTGAIKSVPEFMRLGDLIDEAHSELLVMCESKGLQAEVVIDHGIRDITLHSDPEMVRKVLGHLLGNAVKFTNKGAVSFGCTRRKDAIEFFVRDTGRGIAQNKLSDIFNAYEQEDTELTRGYEGSGLGLAIARGLLDCLGGEIWAESRKGAGSVFFFTLPLTSATRPIESGKTPVVHSGKPFVLVAEDDEDCYYYLKVILEKTGLAYIRAYDGTEAIEFCKMRPEITLVLMDIKMPVINGLEATIRIKELRPGLPVIAVTAHAQTGDQRRILQAGCDDYLSKPISRNHLENILNKYTRQDLPDQNQSAP